MRNHLFILSLALAVCCLGSASEVSGDTTSLPGTEPLTSQEDLSATMVAGIDSFLLRETELSISRRPSLWKRDFSGIEAYTNSVRPNREHLRNIIGAVDARSTSVSLEVVRSLSEPALVAETDSFTVRSVRWPVFESVYGEGLLLQPKSPVVARIVAIPDADQTPEMISGLAPGLPPARQSARRFAENGCQVIVPVLLNRQDTFSGSARINRFTNQPHREWIYRQAYELGRHIVGYEVQKVLAAVDWFKGENQNPVGNAPIKIGIAGYAEGGLIALYAAALDMRVDAVLVSGYFNTRQQLWQEPIYRNIFGLLREFGDAEVATLIAPRALVVEHSPVPQVSGPPAPRPGRTGAAPGKLANLDYESVEREIERARELLKPGENRGFDCIDFISGTEGMSTGPSSDRAILALLRRLGASTDSLKPPGTAPSDLLAAFDPAERQRRQLIELQEHTQRLFWRSEDVRRDFFWSKLKGASPQEWQTNAATFRKALWNDVLGRLPSSEIPPNPRSRLLQTSPYTNRAWEGFEVVLDVFPHVFAWGYLLVPKDLKEGERRPVVVCQHGLEGVPADVVDEDTSHPAFRYYKGFASQLATRGFVVFAPHNPYRGQDRFRVLQRKANPLGKSLFSVIVAQHERILEWLSGLPFVDSTRIAFYGLSYGGKTAMRVPAVLDRYSLSICSGDFNEWVRKNVSIDFPASYMFTGEYEMPEFDLGNTFNYAEMAALINPRPFMVERGHDDPVGIDEWVAYEYAKVRRFYDQLGIGDRTLIEFFNGDHTIHGVGTFDFLQRQLGWPGNR